MLKNKMEPNWQPISVLPTIAHIVDSVAESTEEQYKNFLKVQGKPYVLDDDMINRALKLYQKQFDDCVLYQEQLERWKKENLNTFQAKEIKRLAPKVNKTMELSQNIIDMVNQMKEQTINKILAMDDAELALAVLSGKIKSPL
jgi:membrane-associated HD superfamily phosphohydrolase